MAKLRCMDPVAPRRRLVVRARDGHMAKGQRTKRNLLVSRFSKVLLPIVLIAVSLAGASYLRATKPEVESTPDIEQIWVVHTATIERRDHQPILDLYGELVAGREVTLRPSVVGEVIEASPKLRDGGRFEADELILRIDPFDYQAAIDDLNAQLIEAQARRAELVANRAMEQMTLELDQEQLTLIRRDVERYERLSGSRAASEKAFDDAKISRSRQLGTVRQREQSIVMFGARLDQQDAAIARLEVALRRAERDLADTEVKAPFGGFVTDIGAQIGQQLGSNDAILRLIDDQKLEISFQLADSDFGRLWQSGLIGRDVKGRWQLGATAFDVLAKVTRVVPRIDAASGGVTIYAEVIDNPKDVPLRPGAFIEVELPGKLYQDVVQLPASALFGNDTVYVVDEGRLEAATVELVAAHGNSVLINGDLEDGVAVVTSRLAEIAPGLKVKVVE
ncbi:MAG: efflux RND transporter periplasmic adaptor subunit, partial [Geminicoccaceae bacterium]